MPVIGNKISTAAFFAVLGLIALPYACAQDPISSSPAAAGAPADIDSVPPVTDDAPASDVTPSPGDTSNVPPGYKNVDGTNMPAVTFKAPHSTFSGSKVTLTGDKGIPVRLEYGGVLTITSNSLTGDQITQTYTAEDDVRLVATDTSIDAQDLTFEAQKASVEANKAEIKQRPFIIRAETIRAKPSSISADQARFTTARSGERAGYEIRARTITIDPVSRSGVARDAALYLFGTRIVTIPRFSFKLNTAADGQDEENFRPAIGGSRRYGPFVSVKRKFGNMDAFVLIPQRQAPTLRFRMYNHLISFKKYDEAPPPPVSPTDYVGLIRKWSTTPKDIVPEGDPLGYHSFLPEDDPIRLFAARPRGGLDSTLEAASRVAAAGNNRDDLYVTRLPEARLIGTIPLTRPRPIPKTGTSEGLRNYLRHPTFYAGASYSFGQFYEQPTNIRHSRSQYDLYGWATPIYLGADTVMAPRVQYTKDYYGGQHGDYQYTQASVLVQHYFTDRNAFGLQYLLSSVTGSSPFNFDVLDTAKELDARGQIGNHHIVLSGLARYDIDRSRVFDYRVTLAPDFGGLVPTATYDFRARSLSMGLEIDGVSF